MPGQWEISSTQSIASKYKLFLPTDEELRAEIERQKGILRLQFSEKTADATDNAELYDERTAVTMNFAFATVVAITDIKAGDKLTKDNIWVKRPGIGEILAEFYEDVLGKTAVSDIARDVHLKRDMYE